MLDCPFRSIGFALKMRSSRTTCSRHRLFLPVLLQRLLQRLHPLLEFRDRCLLLLGAVFEFAAVLLRALVGGGFLGQVLDGLELSMVAGRSACSVRAASMAACLSSSSCWSNGVSLKLLALTICSS